MVDISPKLEGKNNAEKARIKSLWIAKLNHVGKFLVDGIEMEILSLQQIPGGVEVMARAWKDGTQIGFGEDGSVDVERFKIYNPPILVPDEAGIITREIRDDLKNTVRTRMLREDPVQAIREVLAHTIKVTGKNNGNIIASSIGHTTATFFPAAGANTPVDGVVAINGSGMSFSSTRSGAGTNASVTDTDGRIFDLYSDSSAWLQMKRSIYGFDTSPLTASAVISSAVFSVYGDGKETDFTNNAVVDRNVPQSTNNLVNSDFNLARWASVEQASNRITNSAWSTTGYNDFTLNATGIGNVSLTALSWYGLRGSTDFDNADPGYPGSSDKVGSVSGYYADQSGTSQDPKLVITYTTGSPSSSVSPSISPSPSQSPSSSASPSLSPSSSNSPSVSPSHSVSPSLSPSPSQSPSSSVSPSISPSPSVSPSSSLSPSPSASLSPSPSQSPSLSPSSSQSPSPSPSLSPSASASPSSSVSASPSPSPAPWTDQPRSATPVWIDQNKVG